MLREKTELSNPITSEASSDRRYQKETDKERFNPAREQCPCCGATGLCRKHGSYTRNAIDYRKGKRRECKVKVIRVICKNCGHTHAILSNFLVPYLQYCLAFIMRVLTSYFARRLTVEQICRKYGIVPSLLYAWKKQFCRDKACWHSGENAQDKTPAAFLRWLAASKKPSELLYGFYKENLQSFLQSHANPTANYDNCVFVQKRSKWVAT